MAEKVKIVKVGGTTSPPPSTERKKTARRKSMRTFPQGILKKGGSTRSRVKPVRDPAKPPPVKPGRTLRILTETGAENRRAKIRKTVRAMPTKVLREKLRKGGVKVSDKAPPELVEQIAVGGAEAGMVSLG